MENIIEFMEKQRFVVDGSCLYPVAEATKVDNVHVHIKCPYCKKTHRHGSSSGSSGEGHRISHCDIKIPEVYSPGYVIKFNKDTVDETSGKIVSKKLADRLNEE
jgi:hypothetical protein